MCWYRSTVIIIDNFIFIIVPLRLFEFLLVSEWVLFYDWIGEDLLENLIYCQLVVLHGERFSHVISQEWFSLMMSSFKQRCCLWHLIWTAFIFFTTLSLRSFACIRFLRTSTLNFWVIIAVLARVFFFLNFIPHSLILTFLWSFFKHQLLDGGIRV